MQENKIQVHLAGAVQDGQQQCIRCGRNLLENIGYEFELGAFVRIVPREGCREYWVGGETLTQKEVMCALFLPN